MPTEATALPMFGVVSKNTKLLQALCHIEDVEALTTVFPQYGEMAFILRAIVRNLAVKIRNEQLTWSDPSRRRILVAIDRLCDPTHRTTPRSQHRDDDAGSKAGVRKAAKGGSDKRPNAVEAPKSVSRSRQVDRVGKGKADQVSG